MKRRTLIASIGAVAGTTLGAAAYSSATVNRSATIDVSADQAALIALTAGPSTQITNDGQTGGALTIDIGGTNDEGLNQDATFTFGDNSSITNLEGDYAFTITSNDTESRDLVLNYNMASDPNSGTPNVHFDLYDLTGSPTEMPTPVEVNEETSDVSLTLASGAEHYVVLTIDTNGVASGTDALGGTLSITA